MAIEPLAMMLFDKIAPAIEMAGEKFQVLVGWVMEDFIPAMQSAGEWIQKNRTWLEPLAVTVGVLAGAYGLLAAQQAIADVVHNIKELS